MARTTVCQSAQEEACAGPAQRLSDGNRMIHSYDVARAEVVALPHMSIHRGHVPGHPYRAHAYGMPMSPLRARRSVQVHLDD